MSLAVPSICIVTRVRGAAASAERAALLARLSAAAEAGATMIQVRERHLQDRELLAFVRLLADRVRPAGTRVLVNDRTDVALAAGADGVHLKSHAPSAADVRTIVPAGFLIGRSVHSAAEAVGIHLNGGCDYLFFGTVFPSTSKPGDHPVAGVAALASVCREVSLPVLAIGGITVERAPEIAAAGAAGVAGISLFADAANLAATVASLRDALTVAGKA